MISSEKDRKSIDAKDVLALIVKRKWLLIIPMIMVIAIASGGTFLLTPLYQSSSIIWIDKPRNVSRELTNIIGGDVRHRTSSSEQRQQLQALQNEITSQAYLFQLIRDLGLDNDPDISREAAEMRQENPEQSLEQLKYHLLLEKLRSQISVAFVGADQIEISIESENPVGARDKVTRLTEILEQEKSRYELERILDGQAFADLQLQRTEHEYRLALDSLTTAKAYLITMQLPENVSSQDNHREIMSDIDKTKLESDDYSNEIESLKRNLTEFDIQRSRLKYTDSLVELRAEIDDQMATFASLMEKYAWDDQNVTNVNIRLNNNVRLLEEEISQSVDDQFASYPENQQQLLRRYFIVKENLDILNSRRNQLQLSLNRIDDQVSQLPKLEADITELELLVEDARKYRDAFRSEETTVEILSERAKDRTKYKIIEPARIPLAPFWPDKKKIIIMGVLLGLVIGGAAVFLVEIMDNSFKRVEDVSDVLQLPVMATIPRIESLPRNR